MDTGEWESLPQELLYLISEQLIPTLQDSIRFSCVCKSWRSVSDSAILHISSKKKLPLLIVPYVNHKDGSTSNKERRLGSTIFDDDTLGVISLFHADDDDDLNNNNKKKVYKLYLPEIENRRICGSSKGWLVIVHGNSEVQLLNPISKVLVHLPPLITAFPEVVVRTFVLNENVLGYHVNDYLNLPATTIPTAIPPTRYLVGYDSHDFHEMFFRKVVTDDANYSTHLPTVVMAIYGGRGLLAFCRLSRDHGIDDDEPNKWISRLQGDGGWYDDVTFYKGNFYAIESSGKVVVVKGLDDPSSPFISTIIEQDKVYPGQNYLVPSSGGDGHGDLLKVMRSIPFEQEEGPYRTTGFKVLKLDFNGPSWVEVTNLGEDCALFVGNNHSFAFSTSKFLGCRGNCIYFTNSNFPKFYESGEHDMGVYNLEDGSFETLYDETSSQLFLPPAIWYELEKSKTVL